MVVQANRNVTPNIHTHIGNTWCPAPGSETESSEWVSMMTRKKFASDMLGNSSFPNFKLVMQFLSFSLRTALKKHRIGTSCKNSGAVPYLYVFIGTISFLNISSLVSLKPNHGFWLDVRGWDILYIYLFYFSRMNKDVTILWFNLFVNSSAYLLYSFAHLLHRTDGNAANFCTMSDSY